MYEFFSLKNLADLLWLALLLTLLFILWRNLRQFKRHISGWLTTAGHVSHFEWTKHGYLPWPKVQYTYEVDGVEHQGDALFLPEARHDFNARYAREVAYRIALAYEQSTSINVYYNPAQPEQSALDISYPNKINWFIGFMVFLLALHLSVMVWHWV